MYQLTEIFKPGESTLKTEQASEVLKIARMKQLRNVTIRKT